jgi:hypothetical protein
MLPHALVRLEGIGLEGIGNYVPLAWGTPRRHAANVLLNNPINKLIYIRCPAHRVGFPLHGHGVDLSINVRAVHNEHITHGHASRAKFKSTLNIALSILAMHWYLAGAYGHSQKQQTKLQ